MRTREQTLAIAYEACTTWMVFKNVMPEEAGYEDDEEVWHQYPPAALSVWGLLVNPADPTDVITLSTQKEPPYYTLLDGHWFELDTYIWGVSDLCSDTYGEHRPQ
jgi:hypothetical protein